ncbi:hypothetical protein ACQ4LE_001344 [Meloidogyne hapla]|uniref:Uncharacterized protein n=1 Tax=Meloidogyne hapla TaxID=6305 RepID=A0A1I8BQL2_MELHA
MPRNIKNRRFYSKIGKEGSEVKQQKKQLRQQQATIASNAAKRRREETEGRPSTPVPKTREESTQTNTKESCDASTQTEVKESCESSTQTFESTAFATANLIMMQSRIKMLEEANSRLIKLNEELVTKMRITNATTPRKAFAELGNRQARNRSKDLHYFQL